MMTLNAASSVELRFNDSKKFETTTDGIITTGNISASSNLFAGGGYLYLTQNDTGDNFIRYNSTDDHIAIQTMDIHLNAANGVGIGPAGGRVNSLFQYNSAKITHPNFLGISGSVPGEMSFTNIDLGGAVGTDEVSGSTIGVISFQGRTEGGKDILGDPYNPFEQTGDFSGTGSAVDIRTLAHIRGGVEVHKIPSKEPHAGFTKTGGFLSFHTGQDSASYVGSDLSSNERMRIDRRGNVGVGFGKIPRHVKMQVRNNIVISSSTFLEPVHPSDGSYSRIGLGPTLALTGLRSGSNDTGERLPQFLISQVKAGAVFNNSGDELYGRGGGSASLEIRARATDRALDTLAPSSYNFNDLIALHIRTYEQENNPELAVGDNIEDSFDINNYPHNGANFGFNMNNPDGFNVNTRQATFGLGGNLGEEGLANIINFRGNTQFRFEGNFYETETFESAFGGANDFTNYVYDLIQPPGGGDGGEEEDGVNVNDIIQLNGPTNSPIFFWTTPNPRVIQDGAFKESPLKWSWAFSPDSSTYIAGNNIVYNVTGSIISGALGGDVSDSSLYNASRSVWSASLGDGLLDYVQQTSPDGFLVSANIAVQKSASHDTNYRFPTFHDNGSYLNERDFYKWGLELNRADGGNDALAPLNLVVTSSGRFKYRDGLSGYINDGNQDIPTAIPGDTNEDNVVNVQDIVQITQFILGVSLDAQTFNENLADFDNDGSVTVQDLVQMINIILSSAESTIGEMRKRNYAINNNRVFRELRNEQRLFQGLGNDLRNAGVSLTGSTSLGTATTVSSSLRSFML